MKRTLSSRILEDFDGITWHLKAKSVMDSVGDQPESTQVMVSDYVGQRIRKLRSLAEAMSEPEDELDLKDHLVYWYVEAKSEWCQFNARLNYQAVRGKPIDYALMINASLGSSIIAELEALFRDEEIEILIEFLTQPLPNAEALHRFRELAA